MALEMFLATILPSDFSDWEWRLYQHYRLRADKDTK